MQFRNSVRFLALVVLLGGVATAWGSSYASEAAPEPAVRDVTNQAEPVVTAVPAATVPQALAAAINAYMAANLPQPQLQADCSAAAPSGGDGGKWCWGVFRLDASSASVSFGRANSGSGLPTPVEFVRRADGGWAPGTAAPATPGAPATGAGTTASNDDTGTTSMLGGAALAAALLVATGTLFAASRRGRTPAG